MIRNQVENIFRNIPTRVRTNGSQFAELFKYLIGRKK